MLFLHFLHNNMLSVYYIVNKISLIRINMAHFFLSSLLAKINENHIKEYKL